MREVGKGYPSPAAFRRGLDDRLRNHARDLGIPVAKARRTYVLGCYLARVFSLPGEQWVLKGGTGLAVRIPRARHTKDIDLAHAAHAADADAADALDQLTAAGLPGERDPFRFQVTRTTALTGITPGHRLAVSCLLGGVLYEQFTIDVSHLHDLAGEVEEVQRPLLPGIDGVREPPPMRLYPLEDQVADKVAALYETYRGRESGRYRDLVDLVLVARSGARLDHPVLVAALRLQQDRRRITLPARLETPGASWAAGYRAQARGLDVPTDLDEALATAGTLVDAALAELAATGRDRAGLDTR